jgi:hypothetical protein
VCRRTDRRTQKQDGCYWGLERKTNQLNQTEGENEEALVIVLLVSICIMTSSHSFQDGALKYSTFQRYGQILGGVVC